MKDRRPAGHKENERTVAETSIDRRDKSIRALIDELVSGTQELKSLYTGDKNASPQQRRPHPT